MSHPLRRTQWSIVAVLVAALLLPAGPLGASADPFAPVPSGHWAYSALEALGRAGLLDPSLTASEEALLTRYEVAGLVARVEEELHENEGAGGGAARAEVALAWLYRMARRLEGDVGSPGTSPSGSPLDGLQGRRQLYWLVPAAERLERAYRAARAQKAPEGTEQVLRTAWTLYDRLVREVPPALAATAEPERDRLELSLTGRLAGGNEAPSDLAARVDRTSQALVQLQSGFGPELRALDLQMEVPQELPADRPPEVVTLDQLRRTAASEGRVPGAAGLETHLPLGEEGALAARVQLDRDPGTTEVRPGVDVGVRVGEATLHAGWRLIDFSEEGLSQGEGEAGFQLRF